VGRRPPTRGGVSVDYALLGTLGAAAVAAIAAVIAARTNSRPQERGVALSEMQAALEEQRVQIDRGRVRIDVLEREVEACEKGRRIDREKLCAEIDELRSEVRGTWTHD
jgi:hypothetical protein